MTERFVRLLCFERDLKKEKKEKKKKRRKSGGVRGDFCFIVARCIARVREKQGGEKLRVIDKMSEGWSESKSKINQKKRRKKGKERNDRKCKFWGTIDSF